MSLSEISIPNNYNLFSNTINLGNAPVNTQNAITVADSPIQLGYMTNTQMNALTPANGMMIYNTDEGLYYGYNGGWEPLANDGGGISSLTTNSTNVLTITNPTGPVCNASLNGISSLGSANQCLTTNSSGNALSWQTIGGGSGTCTSVGVSSSSLTVAGTNPVTTTGTISVNLPSTIVASIAVQSPEYHFTNVSGTVSLEPNSSTTTYSMVLPANDGSSGQFLSTDGGGNLSWETGSGGSGTCTSVGVSSTSLTVGGTNPVTTTGTISVNLPSVIEASTAFQGPEYRLTNISGTATLEPNASTTTYSMLLPANNGSSGQFLSNDGSGDLSWATGSGGSGTVSSVGLSTTSSINLTGTNPITGAGTIAIDLNPTVIATTAFQSPEYKFSNVSGTVTIDPSGSTTTYSMLLPVDNGSSGQFLSTDGSGNLSWATGSGGSGTCTSVGLSSPNSTLSIASTPVTTSGTITCDVVDLIKNDSLPVIFFGNGAGNNVSIAAENAAFGNNVLVSIGSGSTNFAAGINNCQSLVGGSNNCCVGNGNLSQVVSGGNNTMVGCICGDGLTLACSNNVFIGESCATANTTLNQVTLVGQRITATNGITNSSAIGNVANVSASNSVSLGSGCNVGINNSAPLEALQISGGSSASGVTSAILLNNTTTPPITHAVGGSIYCSGTNSSALNYKDAAGVVTDLVSTSTGTVTSITFNEGSHGAVVVSPTGAITTSGTVSFDLQTNLKDDSTGLYIGDSVPSPVGNFNVSCGNSAMANMVDASNMTIVGDSCLINGTTCTGCTAYGSKAGVGSGSTGDGLINCSFFGFNTSPTADSIQTSTAIGYGSQVCENNQIVLGSLEYVKVGGGNLPALGTMHLTQTRNTICNLYLEGSSIAPATPSTTGACSIYSDNSSSPSVLHYINDAGTDIPITNGSSPTYYNNVAYPITGPFLSAGGVAANATVIGKLVTLFFDGASGFAGTTVGVITPGNLVTNFPGLLPPARFVSYGITVTDNQLSPTSVPVQRPGSLTIDSSGNMQIFSTNIDSVNGIYASQFNLNGSNIGQNIGFQAFCVTYMTT